MIRKVLIVVVLFVIGFVVFKGIQLYTYIYKPNTDLSNLSAPYFFIATDEGYESVKARLVSTGIIESEAAFDWVAQRKKYPYLVKPGRYKLQSGMSNAELVDLLRSGEQTPVNLTFNNMRNLQQLCGKLSRQLEPDSSNFAHQLLNEQTARNYGFNKATFAAMFIPNTYEFYWNTSTEKFIERMAAEFKAFWSETRKQKAAKLGLSQSEVVSLASIVESETQMVNEMPIVAGLYINRLKKGMLLQADPTVVFAVGDFSIKRVLNQHKNVDSPYNTYKYKGLPPGPIKLPGINAIEAVLNAANHNYLYMCAKEDFSGYHNFASNYQQHLQNAKRYQNELNKRKIYR